MTTQGTLRGPIAALLIFIIAGAGCAGPDDTASGQIKAAQGTWVVVNYWAEWCKPCIKEVPELNALDARDDVTVLGVNFDGAEGDALDEQAARLAIDFATLPEDPAAFLGIERPQVLPTTVIINPAGQRIQTLVGPQTLETLLAATVERRAG